MELPAAFCEHVTFSPAQASSFLEKYGNLLTWSGKKEIVADVGCADGAITTDILLPFCGNNIDKIFGMDISSDMLQFANKRNKQPMVSFVQMDVANKDLPSCMVEKFDHIFSFYCLHMIHDQSQCAKNLFRMLKPGGEIFLTFLFRNHAIECWFALSENEKWSKYVKDFRKNISSYFLLDQPQQDFERIFRDAGFSVESYKSEPMCPAFDGREQFERAITEVNMLVGLLPESHKAEFLKDNLELATKLCKKGDTYEMDMQAIVAILKKPIN